MLYSDLLKSADSIAHITMTPITFISEIRIHTPSPSVLLRQL